MNDDEMPGWLRDLVDPACYAADRIEALLAEVAGLRAERGRVPVSWDECADWLDAGQTITYQTKRAKGRIFPGLADEVRRDGIEGIPLDAVRLAPPPGLVAAPSGMDGGGFLGAGADVPDGWEWRGFTADTFTPDRANPPDALVQCRPPVKPAERAVVEVPLTQLVGRTIEGETEAVFDWRHHVYNGIQWWAVDGKAREFPDGTLDLATGLVRVYAEGDA